MVVGAGSGIDGPMSVAAADVDQDGDLDLLSSNEFSHDATVFFQTAPGVFEPQPARIGGFPAVDGTVPLVPCDVDQDGDVDLVSGSQDGGVLTVFWNAH